MESKVFAILKKITKEQKTELSAVSDLQDWLDINTVTGSEFDRITDAESAANQLEISLDSFLREKEAFEQNYGDMQNFEVGDFEDRRIQGNAILDTYESLAEELGIDPKESQEYRDVLSQVTEIYPDFINRLSNAYSDAELLIEDLDQYGITIN